MSDRASTSRDSVSEIMQLLLRGAQSRGIHDDTLAEASGVPARTIKSYRTEGKEPSASNALSLAAALGPNAVNAVLASIGYSGARPLGDSDDLNLHEVIGELLSNVSTIAKAAADGRIDHTEQHACEDAANHIIATILPLSSAGRRD